MCCVFQHFVCAKCEKAFLGTRHYEKKGLAYCEIHYHQVSTPPHPTISSVPACMSVLGLCSAYSSSAALVSSPGPYCTQQFYSDVTQVATGLMSIKDSAWCCDVMTKPTCKANW